MRPWHAPPPARVPPAPRYRPRRDRRRTDLVETARCGEHPDHARVLRVDVREEQGRPRRLSGGQHREVRERPDRDVEDSQIGPLAGEALGLAHRKPVRPHDLVSPHHLVPGVLQGTGYIALYVPAELFDVLVDEVAAVRECQDPYLRHHPPPSLETAVPQEPRTLSSKSKTMRPGRSRSPPILCSRSSTAQSAISRTGWASVVSGGSTSSAQNGSSTATSTISSGTRIL